MDTVFSYRRSILLQTQYSLTDIGSTLTDVGTTPTVAGTAITDAARLSYSLDLKYLYTYLK